MTALANHYGTYRGLTPTDESKIAMGEIELTLSAEGGTVRIATGLKVEGDSFPADAVTELSLEELQDMFEEDSGAAETFVGFRIGEGPVLLFAKGFEENEMPHIVVTGGMADFLGPTMLLDPKQVDAGVFEKMYKDVQKNTEDQYPFPLLKYDGKHEPEAEDVNGKA